MTPELGPEARALLEAAREGLGPDPAAIHRMRARIDAAIAGGGAGAGAGAGAGSGALAAKIGALAVVAALAVGAVVAITYGRRGEAPHEPRVELPAARGEAVARVPASEEAPARAVDTGPEIEMAPLNVTPEAARSAPGGPRAAAPAAQVSPAPTPAPASAPAPAPPAAPRADLAREVALVDQAMAALRRGEPASALAAVRVHAAETAGAGQLAEDAAAIEIEALCRLHDAAVAARLVAFDARWPQSAQRSRLTTRCP